MVFVITELRKYTQGEDGETTVTTATLSVYFEKVNDRLAGMDEKIMQTLQKNDSSAIEMVNLVKSQQNLLADQLKDSQAKDKKYGLDIQAKDKQYELDMQSYKQIKHRIVK